MNQRYSGSRLLNPLDSIFRRAADRRSPPHDAHQIHAFSLKLGLLSNSLHCNRLLDLYCKSRSLPNAERLFDEMPTRDPFAWSTILAAIAQSTHPINTLSLVPTMTREVNLDEFIFSALVNACARSASLRQGRQLHALFSLSPFSSDSVVKAALVDMYCKCGEVDDARKVFDEIPLKSSPSLTAMIGGYAGKGRHAEAMQLFEESPRKCLLQWTALISGLVQSGGDLAAGELFAEMRREGVAAGDAFVLSAAVSSAANMAALAFGIQLHGLVISLGYQNSAFVGNALVDMYAKCSSISSARVLFESLVVKDVFTWTTMIVGEAQSGGAEAAMELFGRMVTAGEKPNAVTFVGVLHACGHSGMVEKGRILFKSMVEEHGISPSLEHYTCLLDLLGRAGMLEEAERIMGSMDVGPDDAAWCALLSACRKKGDMERGIRVSEMALASKVEDTSVHVLVSSVFAEAGRWEDVAETRRKMTGRKDPGWSRVESSGETWVFTAGRLEGNPRRKGILEILETLALEMKKKEEWPQDIGNLEWKIA